MATPKKTDIGRAGRAFPEIARITRVAERPDSTTNKQAAKVVKEYCAALETSTL
eukprot:CAMPEP_0201272592 /NCGR_PEP_ID=MMETSP0853-20130426/41801_1 /ASSEMBLY_ACC=CAM_ASM_000640 /TAXON_ID=183588 /ORGANISM="Pseudo-nitzschia fraudulenta, Strain WWA7" /LENGTH=53 /DNA_ID=CAMNT_0047579503 /DNA_START=333 /DNA_END=494 /DNA_ORIENTATION=-